MRLTCPNCNAEYEVPDGMVPAAGRHVQCSDCHTRWFVRGDPRPAPTEDQIMRRLETWSPRPRPVAVPDTPPPDAPQAAEARDVASPTTPAVLATPPERTSPAATGAVVILPVPTSRPAASGPAVPPPPASRPSSRLELGSKTAMPAPSEARRSRFGSGLLLALVLCGLALAAYLYRDTLAARVPAAAPALHTYGRVIDRMRDDLERQFAPLRNRNL